MAGVAGSGRGFWLFVACAMVIACSAPKGEEGSFVDASPPPAPTLSSDDPAATAIAGSVEQALVGRPELATRFAATANGFQLSKDGVVSAGWRSAWTERALHVGARLPVSSKQPFEAGLGVSDRYRLQFVQVGAQASTLALAGGRAVYRDVYPSTDVTFVSSPERLEWAYTLRDEKAPSEFALEVTLPKNLPTARLDVHGGLELGDADGNILLRAPRPIAADAKGTLRDAQLGWKDGVLTVKLDTRGLTFPIVLDPAIETFVWQARATPPSPRSFHATFWDSVRKRVVVFGGGATATTARLGDTWEWDGTVWSLRATTGPAGRNEMAFAFDENRGVGVVFGGVSSFTNNETWEWDGTTWAQRCTTAPCSTTMPITRRGAAMAYDPVSKVSVLFGGYNVTTGTQSDTWTWNGSAWSPVVGSGPSKRQHHMMTYDTTGSRVLLFGGESDSPGTRLNDLWSFSGGTWTPLSPAGTIPPVRGTAAFTFRKADGRAFLFGGEGATVLNDAYEYISATNTWATVAATAPNARRQISAAYDPDRQAVVMYGGDRFATFADTWEYKTGTWYRPSGEIGGRWDAASAFDSFRNRIVLFGGYGPGYVRMNDTWEWTGYRWQETCTSPACIASRPTARSGAGGAYDSARKKFVVFGGVNPGPTDETWEFDGSTWTRLCNPCAPKPGPRSDVAMAYDSVRGKTVIFGGNNGAAETWEWNGTAWNQACTTAPCSSSVPLARNGAGAAFDSGRGRLVMFGGRSPAPGPYTFYGDTWEFDGNTWTQMCTTAPCSSSMPAGRWQPKLAYDDVRKKVVLFSGGSGGGYLGDTWEWNGSTWTQTSSTGPAPRAGHVVQFDATRRRIVAYGGGTADSYGDTWEYYTRGGSCSLGTDCSTGFCVDGVCCEQVSCGTCQACNTAGSPGSCASVISADDPDSCTASTSSCDATGACKKKQGQSCATNTECATGSCADNYCCNAPCTGGCDTCSATPGTCTVRAKGVVGSGPACGAYFCDGVSGSCPTSCAVDTDCGSGYYCAAGGICQVQRTKGLSCNTAAGGDCQVAGCRQCTTGNCVDGYCCENACSGSCKTCGATPGTCTTVASKEDLDTCTGTTSCSASGACLKKNGQSCTGVGTECASGFCIDNTCCNSACSGGCDVCNATPGTCTVVAQGTSGVGCGAYVCNGSATACPTTCGSDADCASGYYCGAGGTCVAQKAKGLTCNQTAGADCKSSGCRVCSTGNCIDGYCCDTACGGSCDACNGATLGWPLATNGTCALAPSGNAGSPACVTYTCSGTSASCATSCTSDAQCTAGFYCNAAGSCVAQKAQGTTCNLTSDCKTSGTCRECGTGNCVDGVCCNSPCGGQCQACDVAGALGTCVTVLGGVHVNPAISARVACAGSGSCGATCNGVDAAKCNYPGSGAACGTTSCGPASVGAGFETTNIGGCDGAGTCSQTKSSCLTYQCGGTTCKTLCTADTDCIAGTYCAFGACVAKRNDGETCTGNNACKGGNCVDGVCCGTASCPTGQRCNLAGSLGKCAKSIGVACGGAAECGSGFCVDGVCCDTGCNAQCAACDVTGVVGTCSPVTGAPHGARSACTGTGAGSECGPVCNGTDTIACHAPGSTKTCGGNSCTGSSSTYIEKHTSTCDGAGGCVDTAKTCNGYTCDTTACKLSCTASTDCATGYYCKSNACVPIEGLGTSCTTASTCTSGFCTDGVCCAVGSCGAGKSCSAGTGTLKGFCVSLNGTACSADAECASKACVDGVCCDTACTGSCEACNKVGSVGKCVPVVGFPQPGHPACTGSSTDPDCKQRCDGTDGAACKYPGTTSACGTASCGGGEETQVSTCDGAGTCKTAKKGCSPYVCGPTACLSACTKNDDCAKGNYCKAGSCVKVEGLGKSCGGAPECDSGYCTDGVCCVSPTCGTGSACAAADSTTPGVCLKKKGVACTKADECATGRCVDGVCCDLACNGQCEACDVTGSEGTCTPVVGVPHGTDRMACDSKDAKDCAKAQCDGKARDKCDGFVNGGTTSCGTASCTTDKRYQNTGACDGAGKCSMPEPKTCTPYSCDVASPTGCKTTCSADTDCADEYKCEAGACVQGATCSPDHLSSIDKAGASKLCTPYRCGTDGKCATSCATSDDCAPGTTCDPAVKACVVFTADEGGDGGCGCRTPSRGSNGGAAAALVFAALAAIRRRRGRAAQ